MAQFKIGDRVRKIRERAPGDRYYVANSTQRAPLGCEGTVARLCGDGEIGVDMDCGQYYEYAPGMLAPLADPRANAFLESIKKIAREPNNAVKVTA